MSNDKCQNITTCWVFFIEGDWFRMSDVSRAMPICETAIKTRREKTKRELE